MEEKQPEPASTATVHNFVDKHLREIKWISYGVGGVAIIVFFRSVRMMQKFTHSSQIPERFIKNESTLQGIVRHVTAEGLLHVEHIPIMEFSIMSKISKNIQTNDECRYLNIDPAGIEVSEVGIKWLQTNTVGKHAWFQMFERDSDILRCDIRIKTGRFFRSSICVELIKQGLCKVEHFDQLPLGKAFNQYLRELIAKEQKASTKGRGLWKEEKQRHYIWSSLSKRNFNIWNKVREMVKFRSKKEENIKSQKDET